VTLPDRRTLLVVAMAAALAFVLFGVLAEVPWQPLRHLDALAPAAGHRSAVDHSALRDPALVVTDLGSPLVVDIVAVLAAMALLLARRWRQALVVAIARLGALTCESLAKVIVGRPRPDLVPSLTTATGSSFPSGHATGSVAVYGATALVLATTLDRRPARWLLAVVALFTVAVGASRVVLGAHHPTDVLGGLALGVAWIAVAFAVVAGRAVAARADDDP
jgi:undecaprenyl-diphosphatase